MKNNESKISATEFKKYFLNLVDEVKNKQSSFIITKRNLPVARVVPLNNGVRVNKSSYFGFMKGTAKITGDIVNFSSEQDWDVNND